MKAPQICLVTLLLCLLGWSYSQKVTSAPTKEQLPNIVLLLADDLGWMDVGFHGSKIGTPNIDELAAKGISFDRFYVNSVCTPTRTAILTGNYPGRVGLRFSALSPNHKEGLPPATYTLAEMLRDAGYKNRACIGKWHLGHSHVKYHPLNHGFSYFYGHYGDMINYFTQMRRFERDWHRNYETCYDRGYSTDLIANEAVRFIEESAEEESPFFLYVPFNAPHTLLQAKEEDLLRNGFDPNQPLFKDKGSMFYYGKGNSKRQTYASMVSNMDQNIGHILQTLDRKGIRDNTIVIFLSDNGGDETNGALNKPLRAGKIAYYEGGVRVPAAIHWPAGGWTGGKRIDQVVGHVDLLPTLQEIVQSELPEGQLKTYDGQSLQNALYTEDLATAEDRHFYLAPNAIVSKDWKLINRELFHLKEDPYETKNVQTDYPDVYKKMLLMLDDLREDIEIKPQDDLSFKVQPEWKMPQEE